MTKSTNKATKIMSLLQNSFNNNFDFVVPMNFNTKISPYIFSKDYVYYCGFGYNSEYYFITTDNGLSNYSMLNFIVLYNNGDVVRDILIINEIDNSILSSFKSDISNYCSGRVFNGDSYSSNFVNNSIVNNTYYDELKNNDSPSEIIISMLYIFIPILLFIIGIKVLRKGLFK